MCVEKKESRSSQKVSERTKRVCGTNSKHTSRGDHTQKIERKATKKQINE